jgi:predicted transcriptional regulator
MSKAIQSRQREDGEAAEFEAAVRQGLAEAEAGKGISYEKIRRWLLSWGSDRELPPPK